MFLYALSTVRQLQTTTRHSFATIVDWLNLCKVCSHRIEQNEKLIGTAESPVQIEEALCRVRRKYNNGRLLEGDYDLSLFWGLTELQEPKIMVIE